MQKISLMMIISSFVLLSLMMIGCSYGKAAWYNYPDYKDSKRFHKIEIDETQNSFQFEKSEIDYGNLLKFDDWTNLDAAFRPLSDIIKNHKTAAFVLIKNDTILYEEYFNGFNEDSKLTSFSVAKSFVSSMIGIAIDEGCIKSVDQAITEFIPELNKKEGFEKITLSHLLNHTSGLKQSYILAGQMYYGKDIWKAVNKLKMDAEPGVHQQYHNMNTQLLGIVIERASGKCVSEYLKEKIWDPIGAEYSAYWSTDKGQFEKAFCCINAAARDYAKFGRLMLHRGNWEGNQLISEEWVSQSLKRDTTNGSGWAYNKSWYLGLERYKDFMAIGLYKQFIYVCPEKDIVIVRFGEREKVAHEERLGWTRIFRQIVDQL